MQAHTKIYLKHFGLSADPTQFIPCEICGGRAVDIHHINGRGKGRDVIENLMALCRGDHDKAHAHEWTKAELEEKHRDFCQKEGRAIA